MKIIFKKLGYHVYSKRSKKSDIAVRILYINNPNGTPRWIWNANCSTPLFLKFYNVGSKRAQFIAEFIRTIFYLKLQRFIFKSKEYYFDAQSPMIDCTKSWALFTGTVGPNNKAILYLDQLFYKVATTESASQLIINEAKILNKIQNNTSLFYTPNVVDKSTDVICLSDISSNDVRSTNFGSTHLFALAEMNLMDNKIIKTEYLYVFNTLKSKFLQIDDSRIPKNLLRKLKSLIEDIQPEDTLSISLAHGDFTQWNMFEGKNKLALYDWELANSDMPIGFDYFHYHFQQGILVERKTWNEIYNDILKNCKNDFGKQLFNDDFNTLHSYLKWYLLINCMNYLVVYSQQLKWHPQIDWLLKIWDEALNIFMTKKNTLRELLIMDFFDFLQKEEYATLKFDYAYPEKLDVNSDIDIIIKEDLNEKLTNFFKNHSLVYKFSENKRSFMNTIQLFMEDGSMLSIDAIWKMKRKNIEYLNVKQLLRNSYINEYAVKMASEKDTARYIALFYTLNHAAIPDKFSKVISITRNSTHPLDLTINKYLKNTKENRNILLNYVRLDIKNKFPFNIVNTINYYIDTLINIINNRGFLITFSGVDGAGKTTVIDKIKYSVEKQLRKKVIVLRHRPSVLPILSVWTKGKEQAHLDTIQNLPRQGKNVSFMSSLFRFMYYYMDYVFGQFFIYFKYILKGYVVIYDRYYFDFINDSKRSNIVLPKSITLLGYAFVLKPKFNFFLYADAQVILSRKKELDAKTITELTFEYTKLFDRLQESSDKNIYMPINNVDLDETLNRIMKTVILKS